TVAADESTDGGQGCTREATILRHTTVGRRKSVLRLLSRSGTSVFRRTCRRTRHPCRGRHAQLSRINPGWIWPKLFLGRPGSYIGAPGSSTYIQPERVGAQ